MKISIFKIIFAIFLTSVVYGCRHKGLTDYSTPEATYRTYQDQAKVLRVVADHRNYRNAIRCFTNEDRKWFESNFDKIEVEKEDFYDDLYRTKKLAYVFGSAVVGSGPDPDNGEFTVDKVSPERAEISIPGYADKVILVAVDGKWLMSGIFNIREKISK